MNKAGLRICHGISMPGKNAAPTQFSSAARSRPCAVICSGAVPPLDDGGAKFPVAQFLSRPYCVRVMVPKRAQSATLCGTWNVEEPVPLPGELLRFQKVNTAVEEP